MENMIIKTNLPVGEQLKIFRKLKNIKQTEIARLIGSDSPHISRLENNKLIPSINTIIKYANVLGYKNINIIISEDGIDMMEELKDSEQLKKLYKDRNIELSLHKPKPKNKNKNKNR